MKRLLFCFFFLSLSSLFPSVLNKNQIAYLMQAGEVERSLILYSRYKKELGKHDFEILQQLAFILLEQGARNQDREIQLLSIYGSALASAASSLDILEAGIKSSHMETQIASIQFLGGMQDDRSDELLLKAMSSEFFFARMEAALYLANRKHKASVGHIESLMYRIPPEARFFFPQFFALIGTNDAISILRHLMEDQNTAVRVEALLSAARFGRDDLLPIIRMNITHLNVAEQEAAAYAIGILKDTKSIRKLKSLFQYSPPNVQIAAAKALQMLGDQNAKEFLLKAASQADLFAITALTDILEGKDILAKLCQHPELSVRMNAAIVLLKHRDPRAKKALLELLVQDIRDIGILPQISLGKTSIAFKPVFSSSQQNNPLFDVKAATLAIRQQILLDCIHLPENDFLEIAKALFVSNQTDLIPPLVTLLENLQTQGAIALLTTQAQQAGMPLIRAYCHLTLFKLGFEQYASYLKEWLIRNKNSEMIQFHPITPIDQRFCSSLYELTPQDNSRLLIDIYQAFAQKQQEASIETLLEAMKEGNHKNRFVLAGLLLRTLQ